jgi:D-alanyl-D-alanine carboxypeptidase
MIALEEGNMSDMVEYSHYDVYSLEIGAAHISRQEDELLSLEDTLYAVMLASANECANATGAYVARKSDKYTRLPYARL